MAILISFFLAAAVSAGGIVSNATVSVGGEDSLAVMFYNLDSLGQNIGGLDTTFVLVRNGSGDSVFSEIVAGVTGRVSRHITGSDTAYCWAALMADIDGSGEPGVYEISLTAYSDASGGWLRTPRTSWFQLVGWELDDVGDSCALAAATAGQAVDSLQTVLDSLYAVLDTLQAGFGSQAIHDVNVARISGDADVANSFEAMLDGTGGGGLTLSKIKVISMDTGIVVRGLSGSPGIFVQGGSSGSGLELVGGTSAGDALHLTAYNGDGAEITGAGSGYYDIKADLHGAVDTVLKMSAAGSADSGSIARWVWNTPSANHTTEGTFGKYLDSEISGLGSGSGMYSYTLLAYDSVSSQLVPGVSLAVRNCAQTALVAVGRTDVNGQAAFNLDADSFTVVAETYGYIFEPFDTLVVTGTGQDTVYGYAFNPGTPTEPERCRVYGFLYDLKGAPLGGYEISAHLPQGVTRSAGRIIAPLTVSTISDTAGYFYLDLIPSDSLEPAGTLYEFNINGQDGVILRQRLTIPAQSDWRLIW
ncbi:MAG: hypothetical protein ACOYVF_12880 [Candidatus Zixiibacteriota bacterium]